MGGFFDCYVDGLVTFCFCVSFEKQVRGRFLHHAFLFFRNGNRYKKGTQQILVFFLRLPIYFLYSILYKMSLGPSLSSPTVASGLFHQSFFNTTTPSNKHTMTSSRQQAMVKSYQHHHHYRTQSTSSSASSINGNNNMKYSYRTCPICSQKLLVRINGSFVYKWISTHFSTHHHEWMHVVVNLHES